MRTASFTAHDGCVVEYVAGSRVTFWFDLLFLLVVVSLSRVRRLKALRCSLLRHRGGRTTNTPPSLRDNTIFLMYTSSAQWCSELFWRRRRGSAPRTTADCNAHIEMHGERKLSCVAWSHQCGLVAAHELPVHASQPATIRCLGGSAPRRAVDAANSSKRTHIHLSQRQPATGR